MSRNYLDAIAEIDFYDAVDREPEPEEEGDTEEDDDNN